MTTLTEKETKAFKKIIDNSLWAMGGETPKDLHDDNLSWHNHTDIMQAGFTEPQAKGLLSSLIEKDLITWSDEGEFPYCVTDEGIDLAEKLFGGK